MTVRGLGEQAWRKSPFLLPDSEALLLSLLLLTYRVSLAPLVPLEKQANLVNR